jgi:heme oxygenase
MSEPTTMEASARSLSRRLRDETRLAHTAAERSGIMQSLLRGTISRVKYVALLEQLGLLYGSLEDALTELRAHEALAFIDLNALGRTASLQRDLAFFESSPSAAVALPATAEYIGRIAELRHTVPVLIGAHAYVRYLGDLSGGQILARLVRKALQLEDNRGAEFYEFPAIADPAAFKQSFRDGLDRLRLKDEEADAFVAEATASFAMHERLFLELS